MPSPLPELVIVGAGGHGRELLDLVGAVNAARPTYSVLGFLDDAPADPGRLARLGARLLGPSEMLFDIDATYIIGMGAPDARRHIDGLASAAGRRPATLVHPRAIIGGDVVLGPGTVICALASLTTNVRTGRHTIINVGATVSHDCRLGNYVTVAPGARLCGEVTVGDDVWVGTHATVIQGLRIGRSTTVGAGAVVIHDVPAGVVAVGVPARLIDSAGRHRLGHPDTPVPAPNVPLSDAIEYRAPSYER